MCALRKWGVNLALASHGHEAVTRAIRYRLWNAFKSLRRRDHGYGGGGEGGGNMYSMSTRIRV